MEISPDIQRAELELSARFGGDEDALQRHFYGADEPLSCQALLAARPRPNARQLATGTLLLSLGMNTAAIPASAASHDSWAAPKATAFGVYVEEQDNNRTQDILDYLDERAITAHSPSPLVPLGSPEGIQEAVQASEPHTPCPLCMQGLHNPNAPAGGLLLPDSVETEARPLMTPDPIIMQTSASVVRRQHISLSAETDSAVVESTPIRLASATTPIRTSSSALRLRTTDEGVSPFDFLQSVVTAPISIAENLGMRGRAVLDDLRNIQEVPTPTPNTAVGVLDGLPTQPAAPAAETPIAPSPVASLRMTDGLSVGESAILIDTAELVIGSGPASPATVPDVTPPIPEEAPAPPPPAPTPSPDAIPGSGIAFPLDVTAEQITEHSPGWPYDNTSANVHHNYNAADLMADQGIPVVAPVNGTVMTARSNDGSRVGDRVTIKSDADGTLFYMAHMEDDSLEVEAGQKVIARETRIGVIGGPDDAVGTPPHLHIDRLPAGYESRVSCSGASCKGHPFMPIQADMANAFDVIQNGAAPAPAPTPEPAPEPEPAQVETAGALRSIGRSDIFGIDDIMQFVPDLLPEETDQPLPTIVEEGESITQDLLDVLSPLIPGDQETDEEPETAPDEESPAEPTEPAEEPAEPESPEATFEKDRAAFQAALLEQESGAGGDWDNDPNSDEASGGYQYIPPTWDGFGGFDEAYQAPPAVQYESAKEDIEAFYEQFDGDWSKVAMAWYAGPGFVKKNLDATVQEAEGDFPSIREYGESVVSKMGKYRADPSLIQPVDGIPIEVSNPDIADDSSPA